MFETLSQSALSELVKVGDRKSFDAATRLDELLACLEQAIGECRQTGVSPAGAPIDCQVVAAGLQGAQRILAAWWQSSSAP